MKIPFLRHFNPLTQLFSAYTLYFTGGLIALLIIQQMISSIWGLDLATVERMKPGDPVLIEIERIHILIASFLVFLAPATIFRRLMEFQGQDYLRVRKAPLLRTSVIVILLMAACLVAANFLTFLNGLINPSSISEDFGKVIEETQKENFSRQTALLTGPAVWMLLLNIGTLAVLAAVGEELFYRGIIQRLFVKMLRNPHAAVIITSLIFSLMHFDFYGFVNRFFMGMVLGYIYLCTGNIWYGIVFHFVNNLIPVVLYWLAGQGHDYVYISDFGLKGNGRWVGLAVLAALTVFAFMQINKLLRKDLLQEMRDY